ncbi:MAG: class I SAM-dependent methyltransferase [Pseudomonadota bacterium]
MAFVTPLLLPFEMGHADLPEGRGVFFNAELPQGVDHANWRKRLSCVQAWRDRYLDLENAGYEVADTLPMRTDPYSIAFVTLSKHRAEAQADIARAMRTVTPGGPIVIGGHKRVGAASIKKWVGERLDIVSAFSKSHWQVFTVMAAPNTGLEVPTMANSIAGFSTAPGMFSHQEIDQGSALLAAHLPGGNLGKLADFGCGWGYLSVEALNRAQAESIALIDAHAPSLNAAKNNLLSHHPNAHVTTCWLDLAREAPPHSYDTIIMNPPFHSDHATNVDLGISFIEKAAQTLVPRGRLFMVANRQLPYEQVLERSFKSWTEIQSNNRFKLFTALR